MSRNCENGNGTRSRNNHLNRAVEHRKDMSPLIAVPPGYAVDPHEAKKLIMLAIAETMFFTMGGGYYSMQLWLNEVVTSHVNLSRSDLSILGASTYITLGLCGGMILMVNSFKLPKYTEFCLLSIVAMVGVTLGWAVLNWLVWSPRDSGHNVGTVLFCTCMIGLGIGSFYMSWYAKLTGMISSDWQSPFSTTTSAVFILGSIATILLKLVMDGKTWMLMLFLSNASVVFVAVVYALTFYRQLFQAPTEQPTGGSANPLRSPLMSDTSHEDLSASAPRKDSGRLTSAETSSTGARKPVQSTRELFVSLLTWRRQLSPEELLEDDCDLSSLQFYLLLAVNFFVTALCTTFMANLGPLINNSDDDTTTHEATIILLFAAVGQAVGRLAVPVVDNAITTHMAKQYDAAADRSERFFAAWQSKTRNRCVLYQITAIGVIFLISILCLMLLPEVSFIVASTTISVGYGMMWSLVSLFPLFFPGFNFMVSLATFQISGAMGTLALTAVVAGGEFNNEQTFVALLVVAVATLVVTLWLLADRLRTEPTGDMLDRL